MKSRDSIPMLIDGRPVSCVSALDRGLLYGDGVFETITISDGEPLSWSCHMQRLQAGCERLGIPVCDAALLLTEARGLFGDGEAGILKVIVTRGCGGRGYRTAADTAPGRILQRHPWPEISPEWRESGITVRICTLRLGRNPALAGIKHLNRLEQVMARREWDDEEIAEGLLLDHDGNLIEGTMSNLFLVIDGVLTTPVLDQCGVAGVMRARVLDVAERHGLRIRVRKIPMRELARAEEVFVCNSVIGIWPVIRADDFAWKKGAVTTRIEADLSAQAADSPVWREH
jgi:4-amino-4-deoxychorismate lyase